MSRMRREVTFFLANVIATLFVVPCCGFAAPLVRQVSPQNVNPGIGTLGLLNLNGGMPRTTADLALRRQSFRLSGCERKGNDFEHCTYLRAPNEEVTLIFWEDELETVAFAFGNSRYGAISRDLTTRYGQPSERDGNLLWGPLHETRLSVVKRANGEGAVATLSFHGGRFDEHLTDMAKAIESSIPQTGRAQLLPKVTFTFTRHKVSQRSAEICTSDALERCEVRNWQPWLKQMEENTAGSSAQALASDTGTQTSGNIIVSWNSEERVLFSGCRTHDCPSASAYFLVSPKTKELDIIWKNERGVLYLGKNAQLLKSAHAYEWLERIYYGTHLQ